jgi:hypothetical protein
MSAPARLVEHLSAKGYHSRSDVHGKILCEFILEDLLASCPKIKEHAAAGRLVYAKQRKVTVGGSDWNIDLVLGPPGGAVEFPVTAKGIHQPPPATIRIAIEAKTIMTKHSGAQRNRQRDLDSFHQFVHRYDSDAVAAAVTVINVAEQFRSPLKAEITIHKNIAKVADVTVGLLRALPLRSSTAESGLEANGVILVNFDNIVLRTTGLIASPPAPQVGDPVHYDSFIRRICDRYSQRSG